MKQIAIKKHFSYFKTDSEEIKNCFFENFEKLDEELKSVFKKYSLEMVESETRFLPIQKLSISHCEKCGHLIVNRDLNPTKFDADGLYDDLTWAILNGGTHDGKTSVKNAYP